LFADLLLLLLLLLLCRDLQRAVDVALEAQIRAEEISKILNSWDISRVPGLASGLMFM